MILFALETGALDSAGFLIDSLFAQSCCRCCDAESDDFAFGPSVSSGGRLLRSAGRERRLPSGSYPLSGSFGETAALSVSAVWTVFKIDKR